ncbi:MAG TPA: PorV/PorQ family protein [bacterium]|nr:PorV/PorQ family protein [bacterium]
MVLTRLKSILALVLLFFISNGISFLLAGTVGTSTADLLKVNMGTRPAGMGGVYTAMGDDAYAINYNPAGLSYVKASQAILLHLDSLADIQYEYLSFATSWGGENTVAANGTFRHSPTIDNNNGTPAADTQDLLGSLSYARKFSESVRAGLTVKYLQSTLGPFSSSAVAFDIGAQLDKLPYGIRAGLSILNLGTGMAFNPASTADPLPMFIRLGVGTHQVIDKNKDLNIGIEIFKPIDQDIKMGVGGEFWVFPKLFAVRGGYKFEGLGSTTYNVFQNYSLGFTLTRDIEGDDFSLDVAYNPADFTTTVQDTFFFGLNFKFNQLFIF